LKQAVNIFANTSILVISIESKLCYQKFVTTVEHSISLIS